MDRRHQRVVDRLLPKLVRSVEKASASSDADVVDQDIDTAKLLDRTVDYQPYSILLTDISHHRGHIIGGRDLSQTTARFLQRVWRASTDDDTTSFRNQCPGAGKAQPFARSSDNRHAIFQSKVHGRGYPQNSRRKPRHKRSIQ